MANEIKIRAKKISDLNQDTSFDFETKGGETFLIVAYKPTAETGGTAQNFRISIKSIIDKLKESISGMSNDEFKTQLIAVLQQYDEVKNALVTKSVLEWAREHGFEGSDAELWQMFKSGSGGSGDDSGDTPGGDTPGNPNYYWYAGIGPVNESSTPGSDDNWHLIDGIPTSIVTGEQTSTEKIAWYIAVPTALNLNHISNGEDVTDGYDVTTVTCADGVEYKVFTQMAPSKKLDITIVQ